jgi:hypothetical protein
MTFVETTNMHKILFFISLFIIHLSANAQKIENIYFNLYTDSLKKGFYNYINIDGKMTDGTWQPLDSTQIILKSNAGIFKGNDLFIDSSFKGDKITVKAVLRSNPLIWKEIVIYIRKRGFDEPLKTSEEFIEDMRSNNRKRKKERLS